MYLPVNKIDSKHKGLSDTGKFVDLLWYKIESTTFPLLRFLEGQSLQAEATTCTNIFELHMAVFTQGYSGCCHCLNANYRLRLRRFLWLIHNFTSTKELVLLHCVIYLPCAQMKSKRELLCMGGVWF